MKWACCEPGHATLPRVCLIQFVSLSVVVVVCCGLTRTRAPMVIGNCKTCYVTVMRHVLMWQWHDVNVNCWRLGGLVKCASQVRMIPVHTCSYIWYAPRRIVFQFQCSMFNVCLSDCQCGYFCTPQIVKLGTSQKKTCCRQAQAGRNWLVRHFCCGTPYLNLDR